MGRRLLQPNLPLVDPSGTHRRECDCPRCDAGFRPSERERELAARRWEEQQARLAAAAALERKRNRDRMKSMRRTLAFAEAERQTAARLAEEARLRERVKADQQLEALLAGRRAGKSVEEALREAEGGGEGR